ncbi:MAG TPA: GAF domain-containing protein [Ktedonosporobacter sp.]|nr:GAF domain-containing protein [Ktedonosporobacter sp.]
MAARSAWRELLGTFVADPAERDRIANEISVHPVTLMRWVSGESSPRPHNLRQLLAALPKFQRTQLSPLIKDILPDLDDGKISFPTNEIPYEFMLNVLETRATTPDRFRSWAIIRMVLQQALKQLDPEHVGMAITVVRCMPPACNGKIRSLRETFGLGTPPWGGDLEEKALLLGVESLAGHVTTSCRLEQIGDLRTGKALLPAYQVEHEVSAIACPLMLGARVAGCLLLSCTQPNYFQPEARLSLIRGYTHLIALAFDASDFYNPDIIELCAMPPIGVQRAHFAGFRERVLNLMRESARSTASLANTQAEQLVWQEIEEALISLPFQS